MLRQVFPLLVSHLVTGTSVLVVRETSSQDALLCLTIPSPSYEELETSRMETEVWVFGYGSLVWKPPISYEKSEVGYIKNFVRRFWQHSTDHRGTPEAPGRVVTLIPHDDWKLLDDYHPHSDCDVTWGVAFKIPASDIETTQAYLDHREKNGYTIHFVDVYNKIGVDTPIIKNAMVYIATTSNESYVGPAPLDRLAYQIYKSHGPSGWNAEYLFNLAEAMRRIAPQAHDEHLFSLESRVRELIAEEGVTY